MNWKPTSLASTPQAPRSHSGIQPIAPQTTLNPQYQSVGANTCDTIRPTLPLQTNVTTGLTRYNTTDTITSIPELRWPNEGYHNTSGRKRIVYDDLSLPEWAVGQLSNSYQIQDPVLVEKALLQTIMALKDATFLPWVAVRSAYANSMHEMEQGTLSWDDQTQWSLNRLSASQIAMTNANISDPISQTGNRRLN